MENALPISLDLKRKPPRNTQHKRGKVSEALPFLVFLVPHVWVAIIAPFVLLSLYFGFFFSEPFPGTVTSLNTYESKKAGTTRKVHATFMVGEKSYKADSNVTPATYASLHEDGPVTVYAVRAMPWTGARIEKGGDPGMLAFATLWTTGWCGGTFLFVWAVLAQPLKSKQLVRGGIAVNGVLKEIKESRNRNQKLYHAVYTYEYKQIDNKTGRTYIAPFTGKMKINKADLDQAKQLVGQNLTVLVDENKPKQSIIYQFCDYVVAR